jgi:hypothetical protein
MWKNAKDLPDGPDTVLEKIKALEWRLHPRVFESQQKFLRISRRAYFSDYLGRRGNIDGRIVTGVRRINVPVIGIRSDEEPRAGSFQ